MEPQVGSERRRGWRAAAVRCAVVLAVCALLVSVAALALLLLSGREAPDGAKELRGTQERQHSQACVELLEAGSPLITNRRLKWVSSYTTGCKVIGKEFDYDNDSDMVKIKSEHEYHISAQMVIQCILNECRKQNVTLIIHHKTAQNSDPILTLSLHLNPRLNQILSASMAISFPLKQNDLLYVTLTANTSSGSTEGWQLKNPDTIFKISRHLGAIKS